MVQAVWSTAHGQPLEVTNGTTGEQMIRLGSHVDPILALLAPLWIVAPSPQTLVAVQIVGVALGALPVYWLARRHLASDRMAALLALAYLAYPWTGWAAMDVFHPVSLAIPLFLYCIWFLDTDRLFLFACCAVLAAACGELMGLTVAALGVWYGLARGRRRAGVAIAFAGASWTLVAVLVVVPAFSSGPSVFYGAFEGVGGSPWGLAQTAVTDPLAIVSALTEAGDVFYLVLLTLRLPVHFCSLQDSPRSRRHNSWSISFQTSARRPTPARTTSPRSFRFSSPRSQSDSPASGRWAGCGARSSFS
jgi:hypothetical protein